MKDMQPLRPLDLRVHAAAFGFGPSDQVIKPLRLMKADKFFLLENPDDRAFEYHLKRKVNVHKRLDRLRIPWEIVKVDLWDPSAIGGALRGLVQKHQLDRLWVNASVGPNTVAIGATLASLFTPIKLFHPGGPRPEEPLRSLKDLRLLPTLTVPGWSPRHVAVLNALDDHGGSATGTQLKEWLREHAPDVIGKGKSKGNWAQREHAKFQDLLERLRDAGSIKYESSHRRLTVTLLPEGKQMRQLLGA